MSSTLYSGQTVNINVLPGESIAISSVQGTFTATVVQGSSMGTVLATDSTGGGTYGPYTSGAVVRITAGSDSVIDFAAGTSPSLTYTNDARFATDSSGNVTGLVGPSGLNAFNTLAKKNALKRNNVATKVLCGALFTGGASSGALVNGYTYHHAIALEAGFDAVRILLANNVGSAITGVLCKVSTTASLTSGASIDNTAVNNSAGTWTTVTVSGSASITLPAATDANNPTVTQSDIIQLRSQDRTDVVGANPIILVRVFIPKAGNATYPLIGNGLATLASWGTIPSTATLPPGGRTYFVRRQDVDAVTTPASFTDTTASSQANSMVFGVQYFTRGQVVQTVFYGDSITQGSNSGLAVANNTFGTKAQQSVSSQSAPVEIANLGWAAQTTTQYLARATTTIPIIKPDIAFYFPFSPNDGTPTTGTVGTQLFNLSQFLNLCYTYNVVPVLFTGFPRTTDATNTASSYSAAQDLLRTGFNTLIKQYPQTIVLDTSALLGNGVFSASVAELWSAAANTTDGLHISDSANTTVASSLVAPAIQAMLP